MKIMAWILLVMVVVLPAIVGAYSGWTESREVAKFKSEDTAKICQRKVMGFSVCVLAKANAENLAKQLPFKADSSSTITAVSAEHNVVSLIVITEYSPQDIQRELGQDLQAATNIFTNSMRNIASQSLCNGDKKNKAFIEGGGVFEYQLKYKDLQPLTTYQVDNCGAIL